MSFEKYFNFYNTENGITVRKGGTATFSADGKELDLKARHRLFVTGDTALYYQLKNEPCYQQKYHSIEDALDNINAYKSQYCLNLSSKKSEDYIRRIYKRISWPPKLSHIGMNPVPENFEFGIFVAAENLRFEPDGYFRIALEIRDIKEGVAPSYSGGEPDRRIVIDVPEGTYDWQKLSEKVFISKEKTALVGYWVEAYHYSGNIYIERPFLTGENGRNNLPEFQIPTVDRAQFDWTAQYLSRQEWPEFCVKINGKDVFCGEVFERCHVGSEWSFTIPEGVLTNGENKIDITYISDYHDVMPYSFHELGIIEQPNGKLDIIAVSPVGSVGAKLPVLVRTGEDNVKATFSCQSGLLGGEKEYFFEKKGLHGIRLDVLGTGNNVDFFLDDIKGEAPLLVIKEDDGVITGTGDLIYISQDKDCLEEYLAWYVSNNIGNLMTMRPTYRWSGIRVFDEALWTDFVRVLEELGMKYTLMVDGRELPGMDCNPPSRLLNGREGYLGRQMHERDGSQFYWSPGPVTSPAVQQFADMGMRIFRERPEYAHTERSENSYIFDGNTVYHYRHQNTEKDYKAGHDFVVKRLSDMRYDATRHTGVTPQFRTFFEAGYSAVGAETMYGSTEPLLAFLRGASDAHNASFRVHLAVQWGSTPHDRPDHCRRYRLALYIPYMQGAGEINTEEGLWRMEESFSKFHRFTDTLGEHIKEKNDFYKYILSHSRKGSFYTPFAFVHGKYDGWHGFGSHNSPWGFQGSFDGEAENSWKNCLNIPYPVSRIGNIIIMHGIDENTPCGYYTGTPYGNVDVVPIESAPALLAKYKFLSFAGYNKAEEKDFDKLYEYCSLGGSLLMTRAHFATETNIARVREHKLSPLCHKLSFTDGEPHYEERTYNGKTVSVCTNLADGYIADVLCDDGTPLVVTYKIGEGSLTLVNANVYPANEAISPLYEGIVRQKLSSLANDERVYAECGNDVQFTIYKDGDESYVYLLAVDWYNKDDFARQAKLRIDGTKYDISLPFGTMIKVMVKDGIACYPTSENAEIIEISEDFIKVQGDGVADIVICQNGKQKTVSCDFSKETVQTIKL